MDVTNWVHSDTALKKSQKGYAHFDCRTNIAEQAEYISNPSNIEKHSFYPFIHYEIKVTKFNGKDIKQKKRDICYAAHIDRCIYQYYCFMLNELYNERIARDGISSVAVAYRSDLHISNIGLAKRAFDFIKRHSPCYIMIGDFTGFFDNLDHAYLKERWCSLLGVSQLPMDHYKVYRSVTKFSTWELTDLLSLNGLEDTRRGHRTLNKMNKVLSKEQFKANKSHVITHKEKFGIPQGSPISALLANVYMMDVDKMVNEKVSSLNGLYMRYSDDFIIVLPNISEEVAIRELTNITQIFNETKGLTLEPNKTQYFSYCDSKVANCGEKFHTDADCRKSVINFLGFTFDGEKVSIRKKTTSKYYYRMYRKADTIARSRGCSPMGKHISGKNLYIKYSERGAHHKSGNFLSYIERAKDIFGDDEEIDRDTKRHMQKIQRGKSGKRMKQFIARRQRKEIQEEL